MKILFIDCEDYCTVIFPAGSKTKNLKINIIDDNTAECNENFSARILPSLHVSRVTPYIATVFVDDDEESKQLASYIITLTLSWKILWK